MDKEHLKLIEAYSTKFYRSAARQGLNIDRDDMMGEMSLVFAKVTDKVRTSGLPDTATFETYLVTSMKHAFGKLAKKLASERDMINELTGAHSGVALSELVGDADFDERPDATVNMRSEIAGRIMPELNDVDRLIFGEFVNPSASVTEFLPDDMTSRRYTPALEAAIARCHNLSLSEVKYRVRKIREKCLTHLSGCVN